MKKTIGLLMALIMCIGLGTSAYAAPADAPESNAVDAVDSPQYAFYRTYIGGLTYADMEFTVSEEGGKSAFESLDNLSLSPIDTSGLYWKLDSYGCQIRGTECTVTISRTEMLAGAPTGFADTAVFNISIEDVVGSSTRESGAVIASSVSVVVEETYGFRMSAEEFERQVAESGIESVPRVLMRRGD